MLTNINKTRQAFWVGIGSISTFLFTILITAILARYLPKEELGTYRQILYLYNTLVVIFSAGLPRVYAYFLPRYDLAEGKSITKKLAKILFLCGLIFSIFLFFTADLFANILNNEHLSIGIKYFAIIPTLLLPTLGIDGIFSSYQKAIYIAFYNVSTKLFMLCAITLIVILYGGTFQNAIIGWIISSVLALLFSLYIKQIPFKNISPKTPQLRLKEILSYSLPIVISSLCEIAFRSADQFYISRFFGPEIYAEFANGFIPLPLVGMITGATATILMPIFSKMSQTDKMNEEIGRIWKSTLIKSAYLIYPLIIFFFFFAEPIIIILYTEQYIRSAIYFQIAMSLNFFNIVIFAPLLFALGKTKVYAQIYLYFAISVWIGDYFIVHFFNSPYLIAAFTIFNNIMLILVGFYITSKLLHQSLKKLLPLFEITKIILLSLIVILISYGAVKYIFLLQKDFMGIALNFFIYIIILLVIAPIFKINYRELIKPLFN